MPNQFYSPEGDLERYLITESWVIDQYIGDQLWTWGNGTSYGQLGTNDTINRSTPVTTFIGGTNWKQVSSGSVHSVAIKTDGTLWVWGINSRSLLGANDTVSFNRSTPITTFAGGNNWKQVSAAGTYTSAIKTDGTLWVWGFNTNGQLGTNDTIDKSTPVTTFIGGTNWKLVYCGSNRNTAIKTDGTLWTWGFNGSSGSLGTSDSINRSTPVTTFAGGSNWKYVSSGYSATMAIKTDGTLWTWGFNGNGQLGTNDNINRSTLVTTFVGGTDWKSVNSDSSDVITALKTNGTLWVWGNDSSGGSQFGVNKSFIASTPVTTFAGGTDWKNIDTGNPEDLYTIDQGMAIKTDGTLWVWGNNTNVQLGINDTSNRSTPVTTFAGGTDWKQVSYGGIYSAAIKTDGTLWVWGNGNSGRLGGGGSSPFANASTPITTFAGGTNWKSVSGTSAVFSIKTDGTLWTWGSNAFSTLGINSANLIISTPVTTFAGGTNWKQVSSALSTAAVKTDGTLWVWGYNANGQLGTNDSIDKSTPVTTFIGGTNWKQVAASGGTSLCAIKTDGTLWTWGGNTFGELGSNDTSTIKRSTPVTTFAGGADWKQVSTFGSTSVCAIKTDGTLWVWGRNDNLQLGTNDTTNRFTPVTTFAGGINWKQVNNSVALYDDGITKQIYTWGINSTVQLGTNDTINRSTPVTTFAGGTNWADTPQRPEDFYTIFRRFTLYTTALKTDGTLWTWGDVSSISPYSLVTLTPISTILTTTNSWKQISGTSTGSFCAIKTDGTLWTWGDNEFMTLGISSDDNYIVSSRSTPVTTFVGGTDWKQVQGGFRHVAALKTDGTLWTWGAYISEIAYDNGELGRTELDGIYTPVTTFAGGNNWADTATGAPEELYTIGATDSSIDIYGAGAIKTDGTLWVWGSDQYGTSFGMSLGTNDFKLSKVTPVTTFAGGTNWKQLSMNKPGGSAAAGAIKTDGTLWLWGNAPGPLGTNDNIIRSTPVTTFAGGADWKQVSLGSFATFAIKTDGTLWVWGNNNGLLGTNDTINKSTPVTTFAGGTDWKQVSGGWDGCFAVKTNGTLWGWGNNFRSRLGTNDTITRSTPVTTFAGGTDWKQVSSCRSFYTAAVKTNGTLWTWGTNYYGLLGTNDSITRSTPVTTFAGGTDWKQVSSSTGHMSAIKTNGTLWVWGNNLRGQLGNNDTINRSTPVTTFAGGTNWKQTLSAGKTTYALYDDGVNKRLYCFGSNKEFALGFPANSKIGYAYPKQVFGNTSDWKSLMAGFQFTAAIKTDGTLWTWGNEYGGALGNARSSFVVKTSTPVTTFLGGSNWKQVGSSQYTMAAVKTDGTLWTWGRNDSALLGIIGVFADRSTPITTFAGGSDWKFVFNGNNSYHAIKTDGTLWVWGNNSLRQLGINSNIQNISTPVTTFVGGSDWSHGSSSSAIKTDGTLWIWGNGGDGDLGINFSSKIYVPTTIFGNSSDWKQVKYNSTSTVAIKTDGTLWVWGNNANGSLGTNDTTNRFTPVTTFLGGSNWRQCIAGTFILAVQTGISPDLTL